MTILDQATQAIMELHQLTVVMSDGGAPDPLSVMGYQSKIVRLYSLVGQEMAKKFGDKERAYLSRKINQAKAYEHGRIELGLGSKQSEEKAFRDVQADHEDEIRRAEEYELYRVMLRLLQNSFEHSRSTVSFLKRQEENPSDQ